MTLDGALEDIASFKESLRGMHGDWDGKQAVLEMKEHGSRQWRQMEWAGFYFEFKALPLLCADYREQTKTPGDRFGNVRFDLKRNINWDLKTYVSTPKGFTVILNDCHAMNESVRLNGCHGEIIGLLDAEYDDESRSFQTWHSNLKGGKSQYEIDRQKRTSSSRKRKVRVSLKKIVFVALLQDDLRRLKIMRQGRNSNGNPRDPKYSLDSRVLGELNYRELNLHDGRENV